MSVQTNKSLWYVDIPTVGIVWFTFLFAQPSSSRPEKPTNAEYGCPLAGVAQIRQGDAMAMSGGRFDSSRGAGKKHGALDLNASLADPIFGIRAGNVAVAQKDWGAMGHTVILDHGDGEYSVYGHLETVEVIEGISVPKGGRLGGVGYTGNAQALKAAGLPPHLHFAIIRAGESGLANQGQPLRKMKDWADYWQDLGAEIVGPVNPGLLMGNSCWTGSTTVGAPGER